MESEYSYITVKDTTAYSYTLRQSFSLDVSDYLFFFFIIIISTRFLIYNPVDVLSVWYVLGGQELYLIVYGGAM